MLRKIITGCIAAGVAMAAGKLISDYAETKPALKNVKDKLKKNGRRLHGGLQGSAERNLPSLYGRRA